MCSVGLRGCLTWATLATKTYHRSKGSSRRRGKTSTWLSRIALLWLLRASRVHKDSKLRKSICFSKNKRPSKNLYASRPSSLIWVALWVWKSADRSCNCLRRAKEEATNYSLSKKRRRKLSTSRTRLHKWWPTLTGKRYGQINLRFQSKIVTRLLGRMKSVSTSLLRKKKISCRKVKIKSALGPISDRKSYWKTTEVFAARRLIAVFSA